jgi:hypothetical protein
MTILKLLALIFRVVTGNCAGGRALSNVAIQLCAAVLLVGIPTAGYYAVPWAWREYRDLRDSVGRIERMLEIRTITDAAKDAEQDGMLVRMERRQESQAARIDHLSDRVSRIEGRRR